MLVWSPLIYGRRYAYSGPSGPTYRAWERRMLFIRRRDEFDLHRSRVALAFGIRGGLTPIVARPAVTRPRMQAVGST